MLNPAGVAISAFCGGMVIPRVEAAPVDPGVTAAGLNATNDPAGSAGTDVYDSVTGQAYDPIVDVTLTGKFAPSPGSTDNEGGVNATPKSLVAANAAICAAAGPTGVDT